MLTGKGPIYQQLANRIAEDILVGTYEEDSAIPSTNDYAAFYQISPITAAKGVNLLVDQGVLYRKRGVGMFVAPGATELLHASRRSSFVDQYVTPLINEARVLGISGPELAQLIDQEITND